MMTVAYLGHKEIDHFIYNYTHHRQSSVSLEGSTRSPGYRFPTLVSPQRHMVVSASIGPTQGSRSTISQMSRPIVRPRGRVHNTSVEDMQGRKLIEGML